jgi:protein-disulfide isomerase
MQPNGCWAARAAEAAGILKGPEGFKKMHMWLFARSGSFTNEDLTKALGEFGWVPVEFTQTMQGPQTLANVKQDIEEAVTYGLHYTPFIFINGIELKGWSVPDSLLSAVVKVTDAQPDPAGPADDHPMRAGDKYVADWREQIAMDWPKRAKPYDVGGPYMTAKVKITLFGDLLEPNTAEADKNIRDYIAGRPEISYQFRYYPVDKSCNPSLPKTIFPLGCRAARAAEAAGQLGGTEAFWKMAQWIMNNRANYSDPLAKAQAGAMGLNADEFGKMMDSSEVEKLVSMDADIGKRIQLPEVPRIFINGKVLPRWKLPGQFVIERVIEEAAQPEPPGAK